MDFSFTQEQEELRATARAFLAETSRSEAVRAAMTSELGYDPALWKRIGGELGWPAVIVPEAYGGLGLGWVELVALLEVTGESLLCAPFFSSVCLGANALLEAGTPEQRERWLPGIAEGEIRATLAHVGPSGRWDASGVEATVRRAGHELVVDGTARFVLDGHAADLLVVAARAPGSRGDEGLSLLIVPGDAAGLERRALPTLDQTRRLAEVRLDRVRLPDAALLGQEGDGAGPLERILQRARVGLAAEQVGGAQRSLDMAVDYAREREQFGRPIGSFQAIQHTCADVMVAVESARSAAYYAACAAAEDSEELPVVASLAKAVCSDAYWQAAAASLQIHGGVGFTWEYDVHLHFKRARSTASFLGDAAWHRERVAQSMGL